MKKCSQCGENKSLSEFYKDRTKASGYKCRCIPCTKETVSTSKENNPGKFRAYALKWYLKNKQRVDEQSKKRNKAHPEKIREAIKRYQKRIHSTPKGKLDRAMSIGIRHSLNGNKNGRKWETLAGYGIKELMRHLERQFQPGMTWDNYGEWHIDHKIPKAAHNYKHPEDIDFKRCWSLNNLQPLWAKDNMLKRDKVEKPFQPALAMAI